MNTNIFADTLPTAAKGYTGYISVNRLEDGTVEVLVRSHESPSAAAQRFVLSNAAAKALCLNLCG